MFFVYENPNGRVRIHRKECIFCRDGDGIQNFRAQGKSPANGRWYGPYDREGALSAAASLKRAHVLNVAHNPNLSYLAEKAPAVGIQSLASASRRIVFGG
jgi:hypothetical protein